MSSESERASALGLVIVGVIAAGLSACGAAGSTTSTATTASSGRAAGTSSATAPPREPAEAGTSSRANEQGQQGPTVPDVIGLRLGAVEGKLDREAVSYRVIRAGGARGLAQASWRICETNPRALTHLESGTVLRLIVDRSCR